MKAAIVMLLLCAGVAGGCQTAGRSKPNGAATGGDAEVRVDTAAIHVLGMACPLCVTNVDKQLMGVPGVLDVSVNLGTGEVRARLSPENPPTREQLARAVERSGLTVDRIEMPSAAPTP